MSSKYSPTEQISRRLESQLEQLTELNFSEKDDLSKAEMELLRPEMFQFANHDESRAERIGYSNYSYWGSTFRMFFKNKMAVTTLTIMLVLLSFTFIQPLLPNQYDPNHVHYYDDSAVWITVDEEDVANLTGMKYTKGDYACELQPGETLAYARVPDSWGTPKFYVRASGAEPVEVFAKKDPNNEDWYYIVVTEAQPFLHITSEDGSRTTYHQAVWIVYDEATTGVFSLNIKKTTGELIQNVPEGMILTYFQLPESWGVPNVVSSALLNFNAKTKLELLSVPGNPGWYYAFVTAEQMMLEITSQDGTLKTLNKGTAKVGDPLNIVPQKGFVENQRPNEIYWFGTNDIGQDLWSRIWSGTRTSLFIGIVVALIEAVLGIIAGLFWGYVRKLDFLFTELYNLINNIPSTIILVLATYIMRPGIFTLIVAMSLTSWIGLARFVRNQVVIIRDRDYNLASRCLGTPTVRVVFKNLLPHMVSVVMLRMALAIPAAIGWEVFMSYIGLGLPISVPSLGNLVNAGRTLMMSPSLRYQLVIPAVMLSIITICFYLIGNAFADAADPKNHV